MHEGVTQRAGSDSQRRTVIIVSVVVASSVMAVLSVAILVFARVVMRRRKTIKDVKIYQCECQGSRRILYSPDFFQE